MMKRTVAGFLLFSTCLLFGASVWEGSSVVAAGGELPETGFYVSTNSFPRNTIVDVKNLETDKTVRAIVAGGLNSPGLLVALSKEAAAAIGMNAQGIGRVRVTMPADPIAFSRFTEGLSENPDPDRNPKAAIAAAGAEAPKSVVQNESTPPIVPEVPAAVVMESEKVPESSVAGQEPAQVSTGTPVAEAENVSGSNVGVDDGVSNAQPKLTNEAQQVVASEVQGETEIADTSGIEPEKPELAQSDETSIKEELSTGPVDIPDDYVPPPALVENPEKAETGLVTEAETTEESAPESGPEMIAEVTTPTLEPLGTESAEAAAVLEDAGAATLSVLDRLPEQSPEDSLPAPDLETPEVMDAPAVALSSGDNVDINETAEPEIDPTTEPEAKVGLAMESGDLETPGIVKVEPELVEPSIEKPVLEAIGEPTPSQPTPGTVELALEPAEERPPEASVVLAEEAFVQKPTEAVAVPETKPTQAPEVAVSIDSSLLVEAIPPASAPSLLQPSEPILKDSLDFIEPIPALPVAEPDVAAVVPQVMVPQIVATVPEKAVKTDNPSVAFKVPLVEKLEKGKYYVQLGAFGKPDAVNNLLVSIGEVFPAAIQTGGSVEKPVYRVFVGPVNLGESGALLMRFKKSGYPDAFVKEGS